jgi:oxygen-independent coproporphyrinogen-3 oxidase
MDIHHPEKWLENACNGGQFLQKKEILTNEIMAEEAVMMGLRLESGINKALFQSATTQSFDNIINQNALDRLLSLGMIANDNTTVAITEKGRLLTNHIIEKLLA